MKKRNLTGMLAGVCISAALLAGVSGRGIQAEAAENTAAYGSIIASGNCGKAGQNVTWKLDADGVLTISGKGDILGESYPELHAMGRLRLPGEESGHERRHYFHRILRICKLQPDHRDQDSGYGKEH